MSPQVHAGRFPSLLYPPSASARLLRAGPRKKSAAPPPPHPSANPTPPHQHHPLPPSQTNHNPPGARLLLFWDRLRLWAEITGYRARCFGQRGPIRSHHTHTLARDGRAWSASARGGGARKHSSVARIAIDQKTSRGSAPSSAPTRRRALGRGQGVARGEAPLLRPSALHHGTVLSRGTGRASGYGLSVAQARLVLDRENRRRVMRRRPSILGRGSANGALWSVVVGQMIPPPRPLSRRCASEDRLSAATI